MNLGTGAIRTFCSFGIIYVGECLKSIALKMPQYHFICVTLDGYDDSGEEFEGLEQECAKIASRLKENSLFLLNW